MADATPESTPVSPFLDDAARTEWLKTGTFPAAQPAESAPAEAVDPAASTDATREGASEPPKPADKTEKSKGAKARSEELDAEIRALNDKLRIRAELRKQLAATEPAPAKPDAPVADPSPAATAGLTKAEYKRYLEMPDAPKIGEFQEIEEHTAAMALFIGQKVADATFDRKFGEISKQASEQDARLRDVNARITKADTDYKRYLEKTPDADKKINPLLVEITPASLLPDPKDAKPHNVLADYVMDSGVPGELHEYFSTPEGTQHWQSLIHLQRTNPRAVAFEIGKLSARFDAAAAPAALPPKTVSTAPEPVETLGKRPAAPTDDAAAALAAGDFEAYARIQNARDWQARRSA